MAPAETAAVLGGGPAGCSAALGLLRRGYAVTLYEQRTHWSGRVCGAFLNPEAVGHLKWLGVLDDVMKAGAVVVDSARLFAPGIDTRVETAQRGVTALGLPRRALEEVLLNAVARAGGRVEMGVRIGDARALEELSASVSLTVLASGRFAPGAARDASGRGWFGWNALFEGADQQPGEMSLHFYPGGYVGVLTFADGTSNVCGLWRRTGHPVPWEAVFEDAQTQQPALRRLLRGARRIDEWRGVGPLPFSLRMRRPDPLLPAGDAAAVGDPFMGEGIGRALGAGALIDAALARGAEHLASNYRRLWRRHYAARLTLGFVVRGALARPRLSRFLFAAALRPGAVRRLLPIFHRGYAPG